MRTTILITGATGNIGGRIVSRILKDDYFTQLCLLVRGSSESDARQKVENVLRLFSPEASPIRLRRQVRVVCGDITLSGFGLPESVWGGLASEVTHVIHAAATTAFQLPLECARLINCIGTQNVIAFARRAQDAGNLQGVAHISTAYVCGKKGGTVYEDELDPSPEFSNTYEQTKWESERYVRKLMSELPVTIFRPSIVIGDSQTGKTIGFTALYSPLQLILQGLLSSLPCPPENPLDVVPVDFVSDAIHHVFLKRNENIGKTYHIAAGPEKLTTVGEVVNHAVRYCKGRSVGDPLPQMEFLPAVSRDAVSPILPSKLRKGVRLVKAYEPYISVKRYFDNANTREALRDTQISVPRLPSYFDNILAYSFATNWGRRIKEAA